jgi:hypothetical protein
VFQLSHWCSKQHRSAITLRYLQTLTEFGVEKNTIVVFPPPLDLLRLVSAAASAPVAKP